MYLWRNSGQLVRWMTYVFSRSVGGTREIHTIYILFYIYSLICIPREGGKLMKQFKNTTHVCLSAFVYAGSLAGAMPFPKPLIFLRAIPGRQAILILPLILEINQ